jgi:hypothetical protein
LVGPVIVMTFANVRADDSPAIIFFMPAGVPIGRGIIAMTNGVTGG